MLPEELPKDADEHGPAKETLPCPGPLLVIVKNLDFDEQARISPKSMGVVRSMEQLPSWPAPDTDMVCPQPLSTLQLYDVAEDGVNRIVTVCATVVM